MFWVKVGGFAIVCVLYALFSSAIVNRNLEEKVELATKQLNDDGTASREIRTEEWRSNNAYAIGWVLIAGCGLALFFKDLLKLKSKLGFVCLALVTLTSTGCWRPREPIDLRNIAPYEEAFLLPYLGDGKNQTSTHTEEYLHKNMVHAKQIKMPKQWVPTDYEWLFPHGSWEDAALLVKVDKSPVTREWTADQASGTSQRNEAIWVMTADQVEFSTGWTCTARIASKEDAVKFLHNYSNGKSNSSPDSTSTTVSLAKVLDEEVRAKLQADFGLEVTDLPMDSLRKAATPHIKTVADKVTTFFKERGISITNLGITGGFVYKDPTIMDTMVELFIAEQQKSIAAAATQAQEEKNLRMLSEAQAKADSILLEKNAEAKGIEAVADAKA